MTAPLQDRLAGLSPEQRALFEKLREKQRKAAARPPQPPPVPRVSGPTGEGDWPLSLDQERFWFMEQLYPGGAGLNISAASRMRGPLSVPAVAAALDEIVRRHAAWRTSFPVLDGVPVQRVAPPRSQPLTQSLSIWDLSRLPEERKDPEVLRLLTAATAAPFPLETGPLVRSALVRLGPRDHVCILTVHHLVTDWISFQIAFSELAAIYAGRSAALPPPPIHYPDFALWQRSWLQGEILDGLVSWWREQLAGFPLALELPTDRPRPAVVRGKGGRRVVHASRKLSEAVRSLARSEGATLFMTVLAATAALLHRLSGQEKLILGANNANRNRPELEPVLGCFLTQVPFPIDLTGDPSFRELLARVRKSALGALAHQDLPFGKLVEAIQPERDTSRQPLVQALVQVLDGQASRAELAGVEFEPVDAHDGNARYDLMLTLFDYPEGLAGSLEHDSDLFDPTTAERLAGLLFLQMESAAADPELRLSALPVLSGEARHQALVEWNDTDRPLPGWTLPERFAAIAARTPEAVAVIAGNERLTYGEIDRRSDDLARRLHVEPGSRVALLLGRTPDVPVAILAAWKAGAAYIPLDPEWPAGRLETVLADAEPALLVHRGPLPASLDVPALDLDAPGIVGEGELPGFRPDRLAYLIYTSGTTGRPKAVMVEHGNVAAMVGAILDRIGAGPDERVPHLSRYTFDVSLLEMFVPLLSGGACEIVESDEVLDPAGFLAVLERSTRVFTVPALLRRAAAAAQDCGPQRFAGLRTLTSGGDLAPPDLLEELLAAFPSTDILVLYGPTETSIICTGHRLSRTRRPERSLIGRPLDGVEARVMAARGQPVPLGVPGELWVGGPGVARGYFRRDELTAERFMEVDGRRFYRTGDLVRQVPSEGGELEFLGRVDDQVKVRGFRIEPGEIEAALLDHPDVREAAVMALPAGGDKQLVAWVVGTDDAEALRAFLRGRLPDYMVPAVFVPLDALPISGHGKVDRKALPAPEAARAASAGSAAPRNAREELLAGIWREALGLERVGIHDNFFQLGGDSILSIQIVARARRAGLQLTTRQFFDNQTIAGLAAVADVVGEAEVEEKVEGEVPLTPVQRRFFAEGRREPWRFNQAVLLASHERLETPRLAAALERLARHHDALRLRFVQEADGWRQFYAPAAPVPLLEVDLPPEALEAAVEQLQSGLDLQHGPLFTAALFHLGAEDRLLLTAHHLIVDAVSWRVLLEDLTPEKLPPKTTSWKRWAELLAASSSAEEIPYWQAIPSVPPLPVDMDGEGGRATLTVELGAAETRALLRDAPEVYRTQANDLLLAALARAFASWTGERTLLVDLEGHGREEILPGVDLSRTVGWFTTLFPVALTLPPGAGPRESILAVKETLRAVPRRGLGFGLLKGLLRDRLSVQEPQVSFNYLGRFDAPAGEDGPLSFAPETVRGTEGEAVPGRHLFAVDLLVLEDRLRATWTYDPGRHLPATAERLARSFLAELEGLVAHCLSPEAGGYSPSDFPLAGLDQAALDRLEPGVEDLYPLAPLQEGILFHSLYDPRADPYLEQLTARLEGPIDAPAFAAAWQRVVERHAALRTAFLWKTVDRSLQLVRRRAQLPWTVREWPGEAGWQELLAADRARGFDLDRAPLMRLTLVRTGESSHRLIWTSHHLIFDGWGFPLILSEVFAFYRDPGLQLPPARSYRDFIAWLAQRDDSEAERHWREALRGFTEPIPLPFDHAAGAGDPVDRSVTFPAAELEALAQRLRLSLNTLVQGAWALLLSRYSQAMDVVFGAVVSGRPAELPGVESIVGLFINTVPVRAKIPEDEPASAWLARFQAEQVGLRQYQWTPLSRVQALSEVPPGEPLFASLLAFENYPIDPSVSGHLGELRIVDAELDERTNYPLGLTVVARGGDLSLRLSAHPRFESATAERLLAHLGNLLQALAADPERPPRDLPMFSEGELRQALADWNHTAGQVPDRTLPERFAAQAARTPDAVAVIAGKEKLTYGEIDRRSDDLARRFHVEPDSRVALLLGRTPDVPVAVLAAWKAGAAYIPLDPEWPAERLRTVLADAEPALLVHRGPLPVSLDVTALDLAEPGAPGDGELPGFRPDRLAYLIYTSGTTGRPKAVMVEHGSVAAMVGAVLDRIGAGTDERRPERVPHLSRYTFDVSLLEIFVPLLSGGVCEIVESDEVLDPAGFLDVLERSTRVFTVPALLRRAAAAARDRGPHRFAGLRTLTSGGDLAAPDLLEELLAAFPSTEIEVLYGPTETAIVCTGHRLSRARRPDRALIGRPLDGVVARVMDPRGQPVPLGAPGELWIGGPGVARGYFRRDDLTAERFVEVDGCRFYRTGDLVRHVASEGGDLEFLGRVDDQVKVRGFRIEPGEIEAALLDHPDVRDVAVVAVSAGGAGGDKQLVAYVVGMDDVEALRSFLRDRLPAYMLPAVFVPLDALPISAHGKVDRKALPAPGAAREAQAGLAAPRNAREELLAGIWREVLGRERVGIHDNFFQLGGDSILSIQIVARARRAGLQLTTRQFFDNQTIALLAETAAVAGVEADVEMEEPVEGEVPLTPIQRLFFAEGRREPWCFNQAVLLASRERMDAARLAAALERLARHHDALRLRFVQEADGWRQFYAPAAPVPLLEVDLPPEALESAMEQLQSGLDLESGPLFTAALFHLGAEDRLLLTAHHLIVDAVSWRVLLEDLVADTLPPKTTSWKRWAKLLAASSNEEEIPYWQAIPSVPPLPVDAAPDPDIEGGRATLTVELGREQTRALLQDAPRVYRAQANDLLLAALARAFAAWTGERTLLVDLEGHGREEIFPGVDLSRTVGWFTTLFPVALTLPPGAGPRESILAVKETLRAVPGRGLGFGLLKGLLRERLSVPEPQVAFNYLGRFDAPAGPFAFAPEVVRGTGGEAVPGRHLFAVDLMVLDDRLRASWTWDPGRHLPATAERLARGFLAELEALAAHCLSEAGGYSPSDFPLAGLDQAALDRLDRGVEDLYPLAPLQEGILFHSLYHPGADPYLEQLTAKLEGPLDARAFAAAWQRVIERHAALRTAFLWQGVDRPLQLVRHEAELPWSVQDWRGEAWWEDLLAADRARGFDLSRAPLLRLTLVRTDERGHPSHRLVWTSHHLIFDGWGFPLILSEVFAFYRDPGLQLPPARSYRDFIAWLAQRDDSDAERHWREALRGFAEPTPVPFDHAAGAGDPVERSVTLPAGELEALAHRLQVTLNTLVQGAWALLLSRYAQVSDVVFGAVVSGRPAELPGVESIVGLFINTVPVRVTIPEDEPSSAWLARLQEDQVGLRQHQWTPLSRIQALSEIPAGEPLFASLLAFENYPVDPSVSAHLGELRIVDAELDERTNYPLTLTVMARGDLSIRLAADRRFEPAMVERLLAHLGNLLKALAADPDAGTERPPRELPMLSEGERRQVLVDWNDTAVPFPGCSIPELFAEQAALRPDAVAVEQGDVRLTYGDLQERAERLARHLRLQPEQRVAVLAERSPDLIVNLLAILQAGGAYLPLDPTHPQERRDWMTTDAGAIPLTLEETESELPRVPPEALAYVMYTSGSTGTPKGVAVTHRNVVRLVRGADYAEMDHAWLQFAPVSFDASTLEIWGPLLNGGRLVLFPGRIGSLEELARVIERHGVTSAWLTAGLFHEMVDGRLDGLRPLRQLLAGGDVISPDHARRVREAYPDLALINGYGPTEGTTFTCCHRILTMEETVGETVPIGRPIANSRAYVMDGRMDPQPVGAWGELCAGGDGLARGYLGRPDLTAERFAPDPFGGAGERLYRTGDRVRWRADGTLEFQGRLDSQLKIRGFRVEPGEAEAALLACPGVSRGAVTVIDKTLAAFWVGEAQADELRARLRERLPEAMVPSIWMPVPDLPLTPNGKVDRRALAALATPSGASAVERVPPDTPLEEDLVEAWAAVLERDPAEIGIRDNFFDLGGHSLLATRLASLLHSRHGIDMPIHLVFDTRNLAELADRILERELGEADDELLASLIGEMPAGDGIGGIPRRPADLDPPEAIPVSFAQERLWFLDRLTPGSPAYNIPVALRLSGDLDLPGLERAFAEVVGRHEALRTTFAERGGTPVQRIAPPAGWTIPVADLSGLSGAPDPAGAALEAERLAREDALTPFDLARGPLLRTRLLRLVPREHVLLLCLHHIVADLWSMEILMKEVAALYAGRPLPELPIQYADFAVWQRKLLAGGALEEQIAFWRGELAGAPPALDLPTDRPRPAVPSHRGSILPVAFGPELSAAVTRLGREQGATPFMVLLAALGAVCSRWSGQDDLVLGSPIANRQRTELEGLIGMFINTLPLRVRTAGGPSFAQLLGRVRRTALAAYEHQDVPFERLVEELHPPRDHRTGGRHPLFQIMLSVQNVRQERFELPGLVLESLESGSTIAKFDLTLTLSEEDGTLAGNVEWATDLFDAGTVERLAGEVQALLAAAAGAPEAPLAGLPVLSAGEALQLRPAGERPQPPQPSQPPHPIPPRNPLEENLVEAAAAALGRDPGAIGIFDNFFDLGGHSLLATRFVSQLYQRWGIDVPLQLVFDVPHLAGLADAILERELGRELGEADDELIDSLLAEMKGDE